MIQSSDDDSSLQFTVKRYTKVMAHHKRQEHRTRRFTVLGNVQGDRKGNCRDSFFFDSALNQRDRLMSYRSSGTQQCCLGALRHHRVSNVFGKRPLEGRRVHLIADERKQIWRKFTDYAFLRQFLQAFDGKDHVQILERACGRVLDLVNLQFGYCRCRRHSSETEIPYWMDHVKRHRAFGLNTAELTNVRRVRDNGLLRRASGTKSDLVIIEPG